MEEEYVNFADWMKRANNGNKTTLRQQLELARHLYIQAYPSSTAAEGTGILNVQTMIQMLDNTPILFQDGSSDSSSLVSWMGIRADWFLNVFCVSPYLRCLREFGCQAWFIRKVCVIEMIQQTMAIHHHNSTMKPLSGTFVDHFLEGVIHGWQLDRGSYDIIKSPTTFISYTGAYTMDHFVDVLRQLDPNEYIWLDMFCVNQFAWTGKGRAPEMAQFRDDFMADLQGQIQAIGRTALILEHWDNVMATLGQIWVLWEIFNTAQARSEMRVLLTTEQVERFVANCLEHNKEFDRIQASLATINANEAQAEQEMDRTAILNRMKAYGLQTVNAMVVSQMRDWLVQQGLTRLEKQKKAGRPNYSLVNNLGLLLMDQGRLDESEPLLQENYKCFQQRYGLQHLYTLTAASNLGLVLRKQGKLREAEPLLREAMVGCQRQLGDSHPETLTSVNNMGTLLKEQGEYDEAEQMLRQALVGRRRELGFHHPDTLSSMNNLGALLGNKGKLSEGELLARKALDGCRQHLGDQHPSTLLSINGLGLMLEQQRKYDEAHVLFLEAVEVSRQQLGNQHPDTLSFINNLGALMKRQGLYEEATSLYQEALERCRQSLGNLHPGSLVYVNNLADLSFRQSFYKEAESLYRQALAGFREELGHQHPSTLTCMLNLARTLKCQEPKDYAEVECLYREAVQGRQQKLGEAHPATLAALYAWADLLWHQLDRVDQARELFESGLSVAQSSLGNNHADSQAFAVAVVRINNAMVQTVLAALRQLGVKSYQMVQNYGEFDPQHATVIKFTIPGSHGTYSFVLQMDLRAEDFSVFCVSPNKIAKGQRLRGEAAEVLGSINDKLEAGKFVLTSIKEGGEIRFKISVNVRNSSLSEKLALAMVGISFQSMDKYLPMIPTEASK